MSNTEANQEISLRKFREHIAGELPDEATSDRMVRLLFQIMDRALPAEDIRPDADIDLLLDTTPVRFVGQHMLLIRHALQDKSLAEDLKLTKGSLRVYRVHLNKLLHAIEETLKPHKAPSSPTLLEDWDRIVISARKTTARNQRIEITALKRFAAWCSLQSIAPDQVTPEITREYQLWLRNESQIKNFHRYYSFLRIVWEKLSHARQVHQVRFSDPVGAGNRYGIQWEQLPAHLQAVFNLYARLATSDDGDERLNQSAVSESTLYRNRETFLNYVGFIATIRKEDLEKIDAPDLFSRTRLEAFHAFAVERARGKAMAWHMRRMFFLRYFADRVVTPHRGFVDTGWMKELFAKTTSHERREHAPDYVRAQVTQVLKHLDLHIKQAESQNQSPGQRLPLYAARFAITFLADHPLRSINLLKSRLGQEFTSDGRAFQVQTKNRQIILEQMSEEAFQAFQRYLDVRRQAGIFSTAVMVSRNGTAMHYQTLHKIIVREFRRGADIHFTPHCFRYLAVEEALERTGDPVYAGAVIGDRSGRVVEKSYNRYTPRQAAREWHALNDAFRKGEVKAIPPPLQRLLERAKAEPHVLSLLKSALAKEEYYEDRA